MQRKWKKQLKMLDETWLDEQRRIQGMTVLCPKCNNTPKINNICSQCTGWGYVKPGVDSECIHVWREISPKEADARGIYHPGMCYHTYICAKCKTSMSQDSSD